MNLLERRYRTVLRLLPAAYRAEREAEMVDTYLEAAGQTAGDPAARPSKAEIMSVAALAVRVRLGGHGGSYRSAVWGEAVRLAALAALAVQATLGYLDLVNFLHLYGPFAPPPGGGIDRDALLGPAGSATRLGHVAGDLAGAGWIAAYTALVTGRPRAAKVLTAVAVTPVLAGVGLAAAEAAQALRLGAGDWWQPPLLRVLPAALMAAGTLLAVLAGFHRDAPRRPVRHGRRFAAAPAAAGLAAAALGLAAGAPGTVSPSFIGLTLSLNTGGLGCLLVVTGTLAYGYRRARRPARRVRAWPLALLLLTPPVLVDRAVVLHSLGGGPEPGHAVAAAVLTGQLVAVAAAGITLLALHATAVRAHGWPRPQGQGSGLPADRAAGGVGGG